MRSGNKGPLDFEGKTVLITGAAGTIGSAAAAAFFDAGASLVLVDVNMDALQKVSAENMFGERALLVEADVTDETQVRDYVQRAVDRFGSIDVFFNNAGITGARMPLTEMEIDHFRKLMDVNVTGILLGLKYVLKQMYAQGSGAIINTASQKGRVCAAGSGDYAASKCAVIMLTKVAALEAAPHHVRVNCIMPGIVHSDMILENRKKQNPGMTTEEIAASIQSSLPLGRWCEPSEVADMVMFLASETTSYLTGTEIRLDGGTTASYL